VESSKEPRPEDSSISLKNFDLNAYGLSYHSLRDFVNRLQVDNEVNFGFGLHYELANDARGVTFAGTDANHDSGRNWTKFAGLSYQFKFGEHWRIGGATATMNSRTYNSGVTLVGAIPLLTYDLGRIKLNVAYLPKFSRYSEVDAFGFYISAPLGR
jgi:hypothetical protein